MSAFDFSAFEEHFTDNKREDLRELARTAESAERYDDMTHFMKELTLVAASEGLTVEERNLLSVAYKNVIGARRAAWRILHQEQSPSGDQAELVAVYKKQLEDELDSICKSVLDLLENTLISKDEKDYEAQVFYQKMAADYYRYLAECVNDKGYDLKAVQYYKSAFEIACEGSPPNLQATHPIRLGLALNYSVCLYEIMNEHAKACDLAKDAFDEAISKLDKLSEVDYKDATLIMQLLRDNLTLWTSADDNDEEEN